MKKMAFCVVLLCTGTIRAEDQFKVCADPLNPPYSSEKNDGFENKIAQLLAQSLHQKIEYTWFPQRIGFIRNTLNAPVNENEVDSKHFKCDIVMGMPVGSDMVLTTQPYYRSTYALVIAKGRGFDDIVSPQQLTQLSESKKSTLKIAMFDRGPSAQWLQYHDLMDEGVAYQSMTGDSAQNVTMQIESDLQAKKIDMAMLWGPIAGYLVKQHPNTLKLIEMTSENGIQFDFQMAIGVRKNDQQRAEILNALLKEKSHDIEAILRSYHVPLLPIIAVKQKD